MVTQIIKGILGKKEVQAAPVEDVPDELPPLAEEISKPVQAAPVAPASQPVKNPDIPLVKSDAPDELPPLDIGSTVPMTDAEKVTLADLDESHMPDAIKKAKMAKQKVMEEMPKPDPVQAKLEQVKANKEEYSPQERIEAGAEIGFFSNILDHIKRHGAAKERLLSGDLVSRMGTYWELRKHEIKKGTPIPAEKKLEEELIRKLDELRILEQKWQVQKLALDEDMKFIHEREREIQAKVKELKLISNELALYKTINPQEYFYMHNGVVLKSLHDLIDVLEVIDDLTFGFHVNEQRNDFAEWIRDIFKDNNLADRVKNAKSKVEMIEVLETVPLSEQEEFKTRSNIITNPRKYFWLQNGVVIRNLYELSDALKAIDDKIFEQHVNAEKNDFAKWVEDVFKNQHLTDKMKSAKTRKEMIELLEIFL